MAEIKLFHISEEPGIKIFWPRPSPQPNTNLTGDVVYAINTKLLHNYLMPRNCPRVCFYKGPESTQADIDKFFFDTMADYVMAVENSWFERIKSATLYCYQMPPETFTLLDECAGYYVSYQAVAPLSAKKVDNIFEELFRSNIELRFMPTLWPLANAVRASTLQFSLIRMRNATPVQ